MKESQLITQIRHFLQYWNVLNADSPIYFHRVNGGLIANKFNKFYRSTEPGTPDFNLCILGRYVGVEAKTEKGRQSENQKLDEQKLTAAGGQYWIIHDIEELEHRIKTLITINRKIYERH